MMIYYFVEATFISNLLDLLDLFDCAKKLLKKNNNSIHTTTTK